MRISNSGQTPTSSGESQSKKQSQSELLEAHVFNEYSLNTLSTEVPLVSVIIPAFNPGAYLEIVIRSVVAQTFGNWEIIVVDDGSTEDLSDVTNLDARVRLLRRQNQGVATARNAGILAARGEYVAFLDADDVWLPDKLALQLTMFEQQPTLGFCHTQFEMMDENGATGNPLLGCGFAEKGTSYERLLEGCSVCTSSVMMRRDLCIEIGMFEKSLLSSEDYDLWLRVADGNDIGVVLSTQTQYRKHTSNMSGKYWVLHDTSSRILDKHRQMAREKKDYTALRAIARGRRAINATYGSQAFDQLRIALRHRDMKAALRHGAYAFRYAPFYSFETMLRHFARR